MLDGYLTLGARQRCERNLDVQMLLPYLKSTDSVEQVVRRSVMIVFPGGILKGAMATFSELSQTRRGAGRTWYGSVPHRPGQRQDMLALEVADLKIARDESLASQRLVFAWLDSSPVPPENWLMHRSMSIELKDVVRLVAAQNALLQLPVSDSEGDEGVQEESYVDRRPHNAVVDMVITIRLHVPVALGLGAASIEDKVAGSLHQLAAESPRYESLSVPTERISKCHLGHGGGGEDRRLSRGGPAH